MSSLEKPRSSPPTPAESAVTAAYANITDPSQAAHTATPHDKRKELSPATLKMEKFVDKFYESPSPSSWEKSKKRLIRSLSFHTFVGAIAFGVTMYILETIWFMLLTSAKVLHSFPTNFTTPGSPPTIEVKSPFLSEVKYGWEAFTCYSNGLLLLTIDGLWGVSTLTAPYQYRLIRYVFASIVFLMSAFPMAAAPLMVLMAETPENEAELLRTDPNYAFERSMKGSISFFQNQQCSKIEQAIVGHNETEVTEMRAFCSLLSRLVFISYFMLATVIIPILACVVCWLQIIINRKTWNIKIIRRPKERTKEQKLADMCTVD